MFPLQRRVVIAAPRAVVFGYLTETERWARWWGAGSTIDPRVDGEMRIVHPGGIQVSGRVTAVTSQHGIAFTYGLVQGIPADGSLVTVRLEENPLGTVLYLTHEFTDAAVRDQFVQGWRYQLAVLGNAAANDVHAQAADVVDSWFSAWSEPDGATRDATLDRIATPDISFRDQHSLVDGIDDLRPHLAAVHRFMPGIRMARDGNARHCQGTVLANWIATGPDGQERGRGTNVFAFDAHARIRAVTGIWGA